MKKAEEKLIELFKSEKDVAILYFGTNRLFFEDGEWIVRGGNKKQNTILYRGEIDCLYHALQVLEAG